MEKVTEPIHAALEELEELQSYESSYSSINKYQKLINTFANLKHAAEFMAEDLARHDNKTPAEVFEEYMRKAEGM